MLGKPSSRRWSVSTRRYSRPLQEDAVFDPGAHAIRYAGFLKRHQTCLQLALAEMRENVPLSGDAQQCFLPASIRSKQNSLEDRIATKRLNDVVHGSVRP